MAIVMNCKNDYINTKMVSDATAVFDITATMVEIVEVGRLLVPSPRLIVLSFVFELILVVELI